MIGLSLILSIRIPGGGTNKFLILSLHKQAQSMHCPLQMWKSLIQGRIKKEQYFRELLQQKLINQSEYEMLCK